MQQRSPTPGDPAPVIALHCSGGGAAQWRQLGNALHSRYELVAPEHYGCDSVGPWSGERAFTLADEAVRTIEIIGRSECKVHLVGHFNWRRPHGPADPCVAGQLSDEAAYRRLASHVPESLLVCDRATPP